MAGGTTRVRIVEHGERTVTVPTAAYTAARADGTVEHLLADELGQVCTSVLIVEDDGTMFDPHALTIRYLQSPLAGDPAAALTAIIAAARPHPTCTTCTTHPCPNHIATHLWDLIRAGHLALVPTPHPDQEEQP